MIQAGIRSPGRRALRDADKASADKRRAMAVPTQNISHMPKAVQEDRAFYLLFLESKKLESKRDPASRVKFNRCINKMRTRWALLTNNDDAKADSQQGAMTNG